MLSPMFGDPSGWPAQDLIGLSDEFDAGMTLEAYLSGVFPMPIEGMMGWWSPLDRGILPLDALRVTRSLRKMTRRYVTTIDAAFDEVLRRCADPARDGAWIDDAIVEVYTQLHERGIAHSVETWTPDGDLVGGLYGVRIAGFFAGESMFHDAELGRDASKVALVALVSRLHELDATLLDVQWLTPHLASMGAIEVPRDDYLRLLDEALSA